LEAAGGVGRGSVKLGRVDAAQAAVEEVAALGLGLLV
jgi:hypothetical protein